MSTVTKLRRLRDGSIEHYQESTLTPAQVLAAVNALAERSRATMVEQVDPFAGRRVERGVMTPLHPDGTGGEGIKIVREGPPEPRRDATPAVDCRQGGHPPG